MFGVISCVLHVLFAPFRYFIRWYDDLVNDAVLDGIKDLEGYKLLLWSTRLLALIFISSLPVQFIFAGDYYWSHQMSVFAISSLDNAKVFTQTHAFKTTLKTLLDDGVKSLNIYFLVLILAGVGYMICYVSMSIIFLKKSYYFKGRFLYKNYFKILLSNVLSVFGVVVFAFLVWLAAFAYLPTKSEKLARKDAVELIYKSISENKEYFRYFTDSGHNFVIYPKQGVWCRTALKDVYITVEELEEMGVAAFNAQRSSDEKDSLVSVGKDKCALLGDNSFVEALLDKLSENKKDLSARIGKENYQYAVNHYSKRIVIFDEKTLKNVYDAIDKQKNVAYVFLSGWGSLVIDLKRAEACKDFKRGVCVMKEGVWDLSPSLHQKILKYIKVKVKSATKENIDYYEDLLSVYS